jgi:hypothetical protein
MDREPDDEDLVAGSSAHETRDLESVLEEASLAADLPL